MKTKTFLTLFCIILVSTALIFSCGDGDNNNNNNNNNNNGNDGDEDGDDLGEGIAGVWDWSTSDDSKANQTVTLVLPKPPYTQAGTGWQATYGTTGKVFPQGQFGDGASTISGVEDTEDPAIMRPLTKTVTGPDGAEVTAFSFTGTVKVSKDNRTANEGSRFPLVGWEAVPDEDTLTALRSAYAYSFWVRVNSTTIKATANANPRNNEWVFKTAVGAEGFANEQGHEFKHYFGNYEANAASNFGPKATKSMTDDLAIGEWHKIIVYLNPTDERYNLDQDRYIHEYNTEYEAAFDPATITKLQWQIALQDQRGITQRGGDPYDMPNGYFDYDVEFYGLELYLPE